MTGFKCCSGRKLSEQHLLNLIWEPASLAAFLFLFGAMPGAVRRGQRGSNGTWQGWWSFLIQGIRQLGPRSSWFIKMLQTMASKFKLSDWLRRRCGRSAASIKYSVTSQVLKCRNIYSVDIPQNQSEHLSTQGNSDWSYFCSSGYHFYSFYPPASQTGRGLIDKNLKNKMDSKSVL